MFKPGSPEPLTIVISTAVYRLLLAFYPAGFRGSYGAQMAHLFRDCCTSAYASKGVPGVIGQWGRTVLDWIQSLIEEWSQRETEMTRRKFIRLSGWALMLGGFSLGLGIFIRLDWIRLMMYRTMGAPTSLEEYNRYQTLAENIGELPSFAGLLLVVVGIQGLRIRYGDEISTIGRACLDLSLAGGIFCIAVLFLMSGFDNTWWFLFSGFMLMFSSLALFGREAGKKGLLTPLRAALLLSGLWFPLWAVLSLGIEYLNGGKWVEIPGWIETPIWVVFLAALVLLGQALQSESGTQKAAS